ncbi:L-2-hydroxyglutarate oxidase [Virgibacillus sp. W0181]|uniref:L-2-hydroxyglutarate oxidase n=1 Tax=Virgibacillus sp. W0181 TaxID=3391581 RepID=UPI003F47C3F3
MHYDFLVIGGGIVGLSTAMALLERNPNSKLLLVEKEEDVACHQTGRNSGVIHSGIYYKPGSLKAEFAREGSKKLLRYCKKHSIEYDVCGKVIVATEEEEIPQLKNLYNRALQNGLKVNKLNKDILNDIEPHCDGLEALEVPATGIINFKAVAKSFAKTIKINGGEIKCGTEVLDIKENNNEIEVTTGEGEIYTKYLVNCAGLFSDRISQIAGLNPELKIIPFKGEYYKIKSEKSYLVNNLIYPVPNPKFPFLGVHFTRMMNGEVHVGPTAVLSLKREGYKKLDINFKDIMDTVTYPAFWKVAKENFKYGVDEMFQYANKKYFLKSAKRLLPELRLKDLMPTETGVRAQALTKDGKLLDDFKILRTNRGIHVCNAPSPAATASISIGEYVANHFEESCL